MAYKIEFITEAEEDFDSLDKSIQKQVSKKIDTLSNNPYLGKPLGNKYGIDLTGFYKLYAAKKKYRIVYRLIGEHIEVIEIVGIGKRDKEEIYKLAAKRLKRLLKT
jgi:mRNA interferase RelE/StbE